MSDERETEQTDSSSVERRAYLTTAATVLSGAVTGCLGGGSAAGDDGDAPSDGGDGSGTTGQAEFSDIGIEAPSNPPIRSEFTVTVSATNTGGQTGSYSDSLAVVEGNSTFEEQVLVSDVPPGETGTAEFAVTFQHVDEYVFGLSGAEATQTVEPSRLRRATGEPLEVGRSLRLTLEDVRFDATIPVRANKYSYYVDTVGNGVFVPPDGKILALLRFSVENTGTDSDRIEFESIAAPNENVYESLGDVDITSVNLDDPFLYNESQGLQDSLTRYVEVQPSQRHTGWILAQFPSESARDGISIQYQGDAPDTPPEAAFVHEPQEGQFGFPEYRLDDLTVETVDSGGTHEVTATVTNVGDGTGVYDGVLQWKGQGDAGRWLRKDAEDGTFRAELAPGETRRFSVTVDAFDEPVPYRFAPFDETVEF